MHKVQNVLFSKMANSVFIENETVLIFMVTNQQFHGKMRLLFNVIFEKMCFRCYFYMQIPFSVFYSGKWKILDPEIGKFL